MLSCVSSWNVYEQLLMGSMETSLEPDVLTKGKEVYAPDSNDTAFITLV